MDYSKFTKKYSISKTLRFELRPVGETAEYIEDFKSQYLRDVVAQDEKRAEEYLKIKELIDDYHRDYIEDKLSNPVNPDTGEYWFSDELFDTAYKEFIAFKKDTKNEKLRQIWMSRQELFRKMLVKAFVDKKDLFSKELITRDLPAWLSQKGIWEEHKATVESFSKFTTYFSGFHENRKNMYSDEDQSTAIAYRLMNENLPKFFNNCEAYRKNKEKYPSLDFGVLDLDDKFKPIYFRSLFTQSAIDEYAELLGGKTEESREKSIGLNEKINLYRQKSGLIRRDISEFTMLYKQILSDRESHSFIPDAFESDKEMFTSLAQYIEKANRLTSKLNKTLQKLQSANTDKIYLVSTELTNISQSMFSSYGMIESALKSDMEQNVYPAPKNGKVSSVLEAKRKKYMEEKVFSLAFLEEKLKPYLLETEQEEKSILSHLLEALKNAKLDNKLDEKVKTVLPLLKLEALDKKRIVPNSSNPNGSEGFLQVQNIQKMLDAFMSLSHALRPLHLVKGRKVIDMPDADAGFYADFSVQYEEYSQITISLYNKVRDYLTKKPYSKDKVKINFEVPTLLNGWAVNKETANASILFEKDGLYYMGIMHPKHKHLFEYSKNIDDMKNGKKSKVKDELYTKIQGGKNNSYRKIVYKLLPGANKMLPKVFFANSRLEFFSPSQDILDIRNRASDSKNGKAQKGYTKVDFSLSDCHKMIDFYKKSIDKHPEWREFEFDFSVTNSYKDLSGFYREVESQGYKIEFHDIKTKYIDQCIEEGKLFLFQIYNKDFSPHSKGSPNLHTMYWRGLFESENSKNVVLKLNGDAEMFYRKHSMKRKDTVVHRANETIDNKNKNNPKKTSTFAYDIVKDRRYTKDKFIFHVPITLNFKALNTFRFNDTINKELSKSIDTCVIGIDRGERHLLYYTVVDSKGNIIEQDTLNEISTDQGYKVNYQQKLHDKEQERDKARKSWGSVENIKELKDGYLSHVVHKLANLIIKHNAIVCLEDLNSGFKRGRFKVEKQVYQKFEKRLIDKLNYLVFKDAKEGEAGHYLNAYQLTAPFESFQKLGKQTGILFYVNADYTSKIDPATGFMDFLKPKYENLGKAKTFFESLESFIYNVEKDYFEFTFDYKKVTNKSLGSYKTVWTACTYGDVRYQNKKDEQGIWQTNSINVTQELKELCDDAQIEYKDGKELKDILALEKDTKFYKTLFWIMRLTLTLRHSRTGTDDDFILSPIANSNGEFFDSRKAPKTLPKDADANGAYNIALKGLWNLQKIREHDWEAEKPKNLNLYMKNEEWFSFIQSRV